jgi:16S rRNA C1402 (ribose-2'-O) methylase RsmI
MAKPHSHTQCAALVKRRMKMNEASNYKEPLQWSVLYTHMHRLNKALDDIEALGHAAHDAGATVAQHELEKAHNNINKAVMSLYIAACAQPQGESK